MKRYCMLPDALVFTLLAAAAHGQQTFQNVAPELGITGLSGLGHSVGWGDLDHDGDPDLALGNQSGSGYWYFRNDGDAFTDITLAAGLSNLSANKTMCADFTGDSYNDLLIRDFDYAGEHARLFENNGDGTFTEITAQAALPDSGAYNTADFNNDGILHLLCLDILGEGALLLFYGTGDGAFEPFQKLGEVWGYTPLAVLDYDRDGCMDILWEYDGYHPTTLLRNNGDETFTDVTASAGLVFTSMNASLDVGDIDNDGFIDIYFGGQGAKLYRNNGDGTFSDITASSGAFGQSDSDRTVTFSDFNNDGYLDMFTSWHIASNQLYMNNGEATFTNVAAELGVSGGGYWDFFGVGWADYNNDGAMDMFAAGHIEAWVLFENQHCPGNALLVNLEGVLSNANGIGAQADLWIGGQRVSRNMLPDPGIRDFGQLILHFGMGDAVLADSLIIHWPSGLVQKLFDVPGQQSITIVEADMSGLGETGRFEDIRLALSPNPVTNQTTLRFRLRTPCSVRTGLYSATGRRLLSLFEGALSQGQQEIVMPTGGLQPGVYVLRVETGGRSYSTKLVKN